jgi:hypothetical protein
MVRSLVTIREVVRVPKNRKITIDVPEEIPVDSAIEVNISIRGKRDEMKKKIELIKEAANDKLFLDDIQESMTYFKNVDSENW